VQVWREHPAPVPSVIGPRPPRRRAIAPSPSRWGPWGRSLRGGPSRGMWGAAKASRRGFPASRLSANNVTYSEVVRCTVPTKFAPPNTTLKIGRCSVAVGHGRRRPLAGFGRRH